MGSPASSIAGTSSSPAPRSAGAGSAGTSQAAGPTPKPVTAVKGSGFVDSKPFKLHAGSYLVRWMVTSTDGAGCSAIGAIHSPDGNVSVEIANITLTGKGSTSGQKPAPNLAAGNYVVTFATTCSWTAQVYQR